MSCSEGAMPIFVLLTSVLLAVDERQSETLWDLLEGMLISFDWLIDLLKSNTNTEAWLTLHCSVHYGCY